MHFLGFISVQTASYPEWIVDSATVIVGTFAKVFALFEFCDQPVFTVDRNDAFSLQFAIEESPFVFNVNPNAIVFDE